MKNELLTIGPLTIYGYGLMIFIGVVFGYFVAMRRAKKLNMDYELIDSLSLWCLAGGLLGARILHIITQYKQVLQNPSIIISQMFNGFVVYGGIIGGIITGYIVAKRKNIDFLKYFDLLMPSVALAQSFGRIGCFLAGCCYGRRTDSIIGITFIASEFAPNGIKLLPTQLIFSSLNLIHFIILILFAKRKTADGQVAGLYLILYSIGRFILEFLRGDVARGNVGLLSTSQFISIFSFVIGISFFTIVTMKNNKKIIR